MRVVVLTINVANCCIGAFFDDVVIDFFFSICNEVAYISYNFGSFCGVYIEKLFVVDKVINNAVIIFNVRVSAEACFGKSAIVV
jgi:hypothetical protein